MTIMLGSNLWSNLESILRESHPLLPWLVSWAAKETTDIGVSQRERTAVQFHKILTDEKYVLMYSKDSSTPGRLAWVHFLQLL